MKVLSVYVQCPTVYKCKEMMSRWVFKGCDEVYGVGSLSILEARYRKARAIILQTEDSSGTLPGLDRVDNDERDAEPDG